MCPSRLSCRFAWQAWHFVTFQPVWSHVENIKIGGSLARNVRFGAPTCLVSSLWFSCGVAVSMGEAPHSTLYTLHSTLHNLHFKLHTLHFTLHTLHFALYTPHSSPETLHSTLHTLHYTLHFPLLAPHSTLYTPHSTLYTPHSTLYTTHSLLYTPHSTLHTFHSTQGCPNDPLENQMMKPNSESHKQNQTNKWWQSAGFLFGTQIGLPLLTIEFLLVRSPKGALQRWRLGWSDKLTGFPRDETLFAVVFLLSKLCFICIRLISKRIV